MPKTCISLPVLIEFEPGLFKREAWGRIERLSHEGASLATLAPIAYGERLRLSFHLWGDSFRELTCEAADAWKDEDGYFQAEIEFRDEAERRRLAKLLWEILSR